MNRNLEQFNRSYFDYKVRLSRLPIGKVNLSIPEQFIDRNKGTIDIEALTSYLEGTDDILIEYELE